MLLYNPGQRVRLQPELGEGCALCPARYSVWIPQLTAELWALRVAGDVVAEGLALVILFHYDSF